ncbi:hypothetical protein ACFXPA_41570, partial [Amycolatopsis sp. NPDC059090]|uniref:hypothetical protein n=1 Tax=Amycolatopsis sp. NPDC059090 TaxID=3346723 RepID=UPI00366DA48F
MAGVPLNAPPQKVQVLIDVGDQRLLRRQAKRHFLGEDVGDLFLQGGGVLLRAVHHQAPVVHVADEADVRQP